MPTYMPWPPFCIRTAAPSQWSALSWVEVTWTEEYWSLPYVSALRKLPARPLVPSTTFELIERPPSEIAVQAEPRPPSGRLNWSAPGVGVAQETATLVTLSKAMLPEPFVTVQLWPAGAVLTVTA